MTNTTFESTPAVTILKDFLSLPINDSAGVFNKFAGEPGAKMYSSRGQERFLFIEGCRENRITLVAHADTVWHGRDIQQSIKVADGKIIGRNSDAGIGADDRAGCALLWLFRQSGHNILITDGEEIGCVGAKYLQANHYAVLDKINESNFILEFDRRHGNDYKCYDIPVTKNFKRYIEEEFCGYMDAGITASTDIRFLARNICAANISVGYYNEHTPNEYLVIDEWLNTYNLAGRLLSADTKRFPTETIAHAS